MSLVIFYSFFTDYTYAYIFKVYISVLFYITPYLYLKYFAFSKVSNIILLTLHPSIYSKFKGRLTANYAILPAIVLAGIAVSRPTSLWFSLKFKD